MIIRFLKPGLAPLNDVRMCMTSRQNASPLYATIKNRKTQSTIAHLQRNSWRNQLHLGDLVSFDDFGGMSETGKVVDIPLGEEFVVVDVPIRRTKNLTRKCNVTFDLIFDVQRDSLSDSD